MPKKTIKNNNSMSILEEQLANLPDEPGVYLMYDKNGTVIYVGKASSLKQRVRSYFRNQAQHDNKTKALVAKIAWFETMIVNNPVEALILESNLIKQYRPRYNIILMDDKHYPYLKLTTKEDFPRLLVVRSIKSDGNKYYGPYVHASAMNRANQLINKIFPLRTCSNSNFKGRKRPCLNAQIGRCLAPCVGGISKENYRKIVQQVDNFLTGKTKDILYELKQDMQKASDAMEFEDAAYMRDQIMAIEHVIAQQQIEQNKSVNYDLIAVASNDIDSVVQIFFVRQGKLIGKEHFFMDTAQSDQPAEILAAFIPQYYNQPEQIPPEICLSIKVPEAENFNELLSRRRGKKTKLHYPQIGDKKRLLDLVQKNANLILNQKVQSREKMAEQTVVALEDLREKLNLKHSPRRIECYDISHIQGAYTVAAMVVFINGQPQKSQYRRFKVKDVEGVDDYAAHREVLTRRLKRAITERKALKKGEINKSSWVDMPDLILIDGGRGQLNTGLKVLKELNLNIPIFGLAERQEEIYAPEKEYPLILDRSSPALQLLQRLRDESHRFAITYHRKLRGKGQVSSVLDNIPGVGEKRKISLLKHFASVKQIEKASLEELEMVPGLNKTVAENVYQYFNKKAKSN